MTNVVVLEARVYLELYPMSVIVLQNALKKGHMFVCEICIFQSVVSTEVCTRLKQLFNTHMGPDVLNNVHTAIELA